MDFKLHALEHRCLLKKKMNAKRITEKMNLRIEDEEKNIILGLRVDSKVPRIMAGSSIIYYCYY